MIPKVSIIIPVYNHAMYIEQTLNSILCDTYPSKEIVLINDGSKDNSDAVIQAWIQAHESTIEVNYLNRENRGLTKTLNELITRSSGQYIVILGSDDYLINNTIEERVRLLENNPSKLMVIGDAIVVDENDTTTYESGLFGFHHGNKTSYFNNSGLKREIVKNWSVVGPVGMVNRKIYDLIGNYDETLFIEDWDFYLRAVAKDLILFYDAKVAAYRLHSSNTINNPAVLIKMWKSGMETAKKNIKNFGFPYNFWLFKKYYRARRKYNSLQKEQNANTSH
ncbi:MAG: glycosyltransferase [Proteobacteria bacterium]|nr:glycosyltransferase [Pseudomonadota bacterium]